MFSSQSNTLLRSALHFFRWDSPPSLSACLSVSLFFPEFKNGLCCHFWLPSMPPTPAPLKHVFRFRWLCPLSLSLSLWGDSRFVPQVLHLRRVAAQAVFFSPVSADIVELTRTKVYFFTDRQSPTIDFGGTKTDVPEIKQTVSARLALTLPCHWLRGLQHLLRCLLFRHGGSGSKSVVSLLCWTV